LEEDFQFKFEQFKSPRELIYFLDYITGATMRDQHELRDLNRAWGENFMRCFLSGEFGSEMNEIIPQIARSESYTDTQKKEIFTKYAEIIDSLDSAESRLRERYADNEKIVGSTLRNLRKRSRDMLVRAHAAKDPSKFMLQLRHLSQSNQLFVSLFESLFEEGAATNVDEMLDVHLDVRSTAEIRENQSLRAEMVSVYRKNRESEYIDNPEKLDELCARLHEKLDDQNTECITLQHDENLLGFVLITEKPNGTFEASGLNVDPPIKGTKAGLLLVKQIDQYARSGKIITASANLQNAQAYIRTQGMVGVGVEDIAGIPFIRVERNDAVTYPTTGIVKTVASISEIPEALENNKFVITRLWQSENGIDLTLVERSKATPAQPSATAPQRRIAA
jgi:N-acetylglutamate synthase-like GNAT family acetyltransferase